MRKFFAKLSENELLIAFAFYFILSVILTYPLFFKMGSSVWGNPGDNTSFLTRGFSSLGLEALVSYEGVLLSALGGRVFAFNFLSFISFPLAGVTMFALAKHVLGKNGTLAPALFAGAVFAFCPYHFWQSYDHMTLGQIQWLPLFFLALLFFLEKPNLKRGILLGLSWNLNFLTNLHYGYFTLLLAGAFILSNFLCHSGESRSGAAGEGRLQNPFPNKTDSGQARVTLTGILSLLVISGLGILLWYYRSKLAQSEILGPGFGRPLDEIFALSARPWDYFIPAPNHLLWGHAGQELLAKIWHLKPDYRFLSPFLPERVIYLGLVPFFFAIYAFLHPTLKVGLRVGTIVLTIVFLFLLSFPPFFDTSHGRLFFPNYLLAHSFPLVRVYARLGIIVEMLVALLTGLGLYGLLLKGKKYLPYLAFVLLLLEFLPFPHPFTTIP